MNDLDLLIERLRSALHDPNGLVWSDAELSEALRQALEDLIDAAGQSWLLAGLDGDSHATNFPTHYFALLTRGALGYALLACAAERVHSFPAAESGARALAAGQAQLERFNLGLGWLQKHRLEELHTAADAPYPAGAAAHWDLEG